MKKNKNKKLSSLLTNEWPAHGAMFTGDGDSSELVPTLASTFDQVQLLKSRTCINPQIRVILMHEYT